MEESDVTSGPAALDALRAHVVNLRQGRFSDDGDFSMDAEGAARLVDETLAAWVDGRIEAGETPRIMLYAHGGLNSEGDALAYAGRLHRWWLEQGIYPIFFVWETGAWESVLQVLEEHWRGDQGDEGDKGRGIGEWVRERTDAAIEALVRSIGRDPWTLMKLSALRASEEAPEAGGRVLAQLLDGLRRRVLEARGVALELHAVGHSAGAIFQAHFLRACHVGECAIDFRTLSLLAPACTVSLFEEIMAPSLDGGHVGHLSLFCLERERERADSTVPAYSKSLLHLVGKGFERGAPCPILGMQEALEADPELGRRFGLADGGRDGVSVVFSPTAQGGDERLRAGAITHGGFSEDAATLRALALRMRGLTSDAALADPPRAESARGAEGAGLVPSLSERLPEEAYAALFGRETGAPSPALAPVPAASSVAGVRSGGARRALCIGIDDYPEPWRLSGCVNDARSWAAAFGGLGFETRLLTDAEATWEGILGAIRGLVAGASAGDLIVVQYAGHGVQFADEDGDEEDGMDEALVPHDSNDRLYVADDELWEVLEGGSDDALVYVFMDCCHSMTNSRAMPMRPRAGRPVRLPEKARALRAPSDGRDAHRERLASRGLSSAPVRRGNEEQRHHKYAACSDKQLAYEAEGQGKFTRAALAVLADAPAGMNNAGFIERTLERFAPDANQTPGIDCRPDRRAQPFLGGLFDG